MDSNIITIKASNASHAHKMGTATAKFRNAEIDDFRPKLAVNELFRGSLLRDADNPGVNIQSQRFVECLVCRRGS